MFSSKVDDELEKAPITIIPSEPANSSTKVDLIIFNTVPSPPAIPLASTTLP